MVIKKIMAVLLTAVGLCMSLSVSVSAETIYPFSSGKASLLRKYPNTSSSYTISVLNFKSTNIKEVTVAVSNTNISTTNHTFSLSASVSY